MNKTEKQKRNLIIGTSVLVILTFVQIWYIGGLKSFFFAMTSKDSTSFAKEYSYFSWINLKEGDSKSLVKKALGNPVNIWLRDDVEVWDFSQSLTSSHYHIRQIEFSKLGEISKKLGYYYLD